MNDGAPEPNDRAPEPKAPLSDVAAMGQRVRALRRQAGLSMVELGSKAGISQPFLSQLERGLATPSLTTIYALAEALEVHPSQFLHSKGTAPSSTSSGPLIRVHDDAADTARVLIAGDSGALLQAYEHSFSPGQPPRPWFEHEGEDFVYVLSGRVELQLKGRPARILSARQSAHYPGNVPHRCVLAGRRPARTLLVVGGRWTPTL